MPITKRSYCFTILLSAFAAGLAQVGDKQWIVTSAYLLMIIYLLIDTKYSYRYKVILTWVSGFIFFLSLESWMIDINLTGINIEPSYATNSIKILTWLISSALWSIKFLLLSIIFLVTSKYSKNKSSKYVLLCSSWVLGEYLGSLIFSLFNYGENSTIAPNWSFGSLGLIFIDSPLKYASRVVGLYGLSFLVVLIFTSFYHIIIKKNLSYYSIVGLFLSIMTVMIGFHYSQSNGRPIKFETTIVHVPFDLSNEYPVYKEFKSYPINSTKKRLVILPEHSGIFDVKTSPQRQKDIISSFDYQTGEIYFIDSNSII